VTLWGRLDLEYIRAEAQSLSMSDQFEEWLEKARHEVKDEK
jgi:hypothetical protein